MILREDFSVWTPKKKEKRTNEKDQRNMDGKRTPAGRISYRDAERNRIRSQHSGHRYQDLRSRCFGIASGIFIRYIQESVFEEIKKKAVEMAAFFVL